MADWEYIPMTSAARDALIGLSLLWVLFGVVVGLRLLGRKKGVGIGVDDILAVVAFLFSGSTIGFNAAVFVAGVGHDFDPTSDIYPDLITNLPHLMKITFIFTLVYIWSLAALKLSQLTFYLRAFSLLHLRYAIYLSIAIVLAWGLAFTFVFIFLCTPISQQWTLQRIGHCLDQISTLKALIMTNVLTDVLIVVLPMWTVWRLQMRLAEKIAVLGCFAIGLACVVIGIVRFWQIYVIDMLGNFTGTSLTTFMLCTVELMLAGICISIPMLRPWYLRWRGKGSAQSGTGGSRSFDVEGRVTVSGSKQKGRKKVGESEPETFTAWIELDGDKENEVESSNDGGSERQLTQTISRTEGKKASVVLVSTNWEVTREERTT